VQHQLHADERQNQREAGGEVDEPVEQAAQDHARLATGADGVDALRLVDAVADGDRWTIRFRDPDVSVVLRERRVDTGRPLTCAATAPGCMRVFDVLSVQ
jgi:hypothetical protein